MHKQQSFSNHRRFVPVFHYFLVPSIVLLSIGSVVNLVKSDQSNFYSASLICFMSVLLIFIAMYARSFALVAQDRAIRAEENMRHYVMTGKTLPNDLRLSQIIAIRFASDEEYVSLIERAREQKLSATDIKKSIQDWRADNHRV